MRVQSISLALGAALCWLAAAATAQEADLSVYVGHHPVQAVEGVAFIDHPAVAGLVERSLEDPALRGMVLAQTREQAYATDIFESEGKIYFYAYDPTHGSENDWGIAISPDGLDGAVCVAVGAVGEAPTQGDWYRDGQVVSVSEDSCPSEPYGLAMAFGG